MRFLSCIFRLAIIRARLKKKQGIGCNGKIRFDQRLACLILWMGIFNILSYKDVNEDKEISEGSVAATILKIQEKKTQKGTSYAIIKFSDQSSIFELFVFSDTFELNRSKIKEGNSVILTLQKITKPNDPQSTRLNVKKIISLDDLINKPINSISFKVKNVDEVDTLSIMLKKGGDVEVNIDVVPSDKAYKIKLKDKRLIDRKTVNLIKNQGISTTIH